MRIPSVHAVLVAVAFALLPTAAPARADDTGACCFGCDTGDMLALCQELTRDACCVADGLFLGENIGCGETGAGYTIDCDQGTGSCGGGSFEDISATGDALAVGDESTVVRAIGFDFEFYGMTHTSATVSDNGFITFEPAPGLTFENQTLPDPAAPNNLIAPLWNDFNPGAGGAVYAQTLGAAPNRRFIVQWDSVPQFDNTDENTFQLALFEGSNRIEFRYGPFTPAAFAGDHTIGVESGGGALATSVMSLMGLQDIAVVPMAGGSPCDNLCRGDLNGDSTVDIFDFAQLAQNFGRFSDAGRCDGDLTCDGLINSFDFAELAVKFGCTGAATPEQCCAPVGGCRFCDAMCEDLTSAACDLAGGLWEGPATMCSQITPEGLGACCLTGDTCADDLTAPLCSGMGGDYQGDCTICELAPCAAGACCLCDATCQDQITPDACAAMGGLSRPGVACAAAECALFGACCLCDGSCLELTADTCQSLGGDYKGLCTTCANQECTPTGACCVDDGMCIDNIAAFICEGQQVNGLYKGDCLTCQQAACDMGYCCTCDQCIDNVDLPTCTALEGTLIFGLTCQEGFCDTSGACCLPDDTCMDNVTQPVCQGSNLNGTYQGDCTDCATTNCAPGACCACDSMCIDNTDLPACNLLLGEFLPNQACQDVLCSPLGACCLPDGSCVDGVAQIPCLGALNGVVWLECEPCQSVACPAP